MTVEKRTNIADIFPSYLFWDMDMNNLDLNRDKDIIIPRALFATTVDTFVKDIKRLENFYKRNEIIYELSHTKERVSNKICKLVADRYQISAFSRFK